jgi:multisubunit Na+/H+ antiporter MnhF subunit
MTLFWIVLAAVVAVVLGNALILLRTAKKPDIPDSVRPKPYRDDDEGGW